MIYFDNAASTPVYPGVIDVMTACHADLFGNPSAIHGQGRNARVALEYSRRKIATLLSAAPSEIYFTSGGTEANNAILWGCCRSLGRNNFITSRLEHSSVLRVLEGMVRYSGVNLCFVHHDDKGHIDLDHLEYLLKHTPGSVVSLMHGNNEIGNLLPVKDVSDLCVKYGALFHSDTVQTLGKFHLSMDKLPFDFAVGSAHKFHGPKGVGFMFIRKGSSFDAFVAGGGQERNMRAGTENLCGIVGMAKALECGSATSKKNEAYIRNLKEYLIHSLKEQLPAIRFNGDAEGHSLYSIVNLLLPGRLDPDMLVARFDIAGICISSGSACSSGSSTGSHVLEALGRSPDEPSIRVSLSHYNTIDEVKELIRVIKLPIP